MRGTYFVKYPKGNSKNQLQKLMDCQATRTKVAHAVGYAKKKKVESDEDIIVTDDTPEYQAIWEMAADNAFEVANADD